MKYKVKTKNTIVTVNADNIADGIEMSTRSDFVVFYILVDDGFHKRPIKKEVARFREDDIEFVICEENCEVATINNEETGETDDI